MELLVTWTLLSFLTLIAGATAVAVYWLALRATLVLMRPATVRSTPAAAHSRTGRCSERYNQPDSDSRERKEGAALC